jgi:ABC-type multidrug transport system fused ATPase/permease subunit
VNWINGDRDKLKGAMIMLSFILIFLISIVLRIIYTFYANKQAININRGISTLLFSKILKLPQRFVAKIGTGKLVSLVSGELQTLEKTMWYIPYILVAPISNIAWFAYFAVYFYEASPIAFGFQLAVLVIFIILSIITTKLKFKESKFQNVTFRLSFRC